MQEQTISDRVATALHRFPVAFICILLVSLGWLLFSFDVLSIETRPNRSFVFWVCLSGLNVTGILSVVFRLRREAGSQNPTWLKLLAGCFFALLLVWTYYSGCRASGDEDISLLTSLFAPVSLLFALPFLQDRDESRLLRFTSHAIVFGVAALAVTGFCAAGLILLLGRDGSVLVINLIIGFFIVFLFPCLCLIGLPRIEGADVAEGREAKAGKALNPGLGCRLLAGITALWMLLSFAYGIATFYMNRFTVSLFVQTSFYSMLLLLILYLLPDHIKSERMRKLWMKLLTVGQLLLLLLMEIASWSRPFAFWPGTGPFLMLIGLFCIAACLILLLAGQKKFRILFFCLFVFLVLIGLYPKMITAFEENRRKERMAVALVDDRSHGRIFESDEDARAFLKKIPEERARFCRDLVDLYENDSCPSCIKQEYSENLIDLCYSPAKESL